MSEEEGQLHMLEIKLVKKTVRHGHGPVQVFLPVPRHHPGSAAQKAASGSDIEISLDEFTRLEAHERGLAQESGI